MGIILDTSAVIVLERRATGWDALFETAGDLPVFMPAIVWGELLVGVQLADSVDRALKRKERLDRLRASVPIIPFTEATAAIYAELFAEASNRGKPIPTNDLCVICTAVLYGHSVLVGPKQEKHFQQVSRVRVVVL